MGRPIIGITGELDAARWGDWIREAVISPVSYTRTVERAGAAPVVLPSGAAVLGARPSSARSTAWSSPAAGTWTRRCTARSAAAETDEPDRRRDRFELALMRAALDAGLPFLAIGRGLHVLTVARGGTLTQDLPGHCEQRARYTPHDVVLGADSLLGRLLGTRVSVPAAHHQAPYHLGDGLTVAGWSPDGEVTEAAGGRRAAFRRRHPLAPGGGRRPAPAHRPRRGREPAEAAGDGEARAAQQPRKPVAMKPKAGARR